MLQCNALRCAVSLRVVFVSWAPPWSRKTYTIDSCIDRFAGLSSVGASRETIVAGMYSAGGRFPLNFLVSLII